LDECRGKFDSYEQQAGDRCGSSTYKFESQQVPKCKRYLTDGDARDAVEGMSSQQTFKVITFYVIIDHLKSTLEKRIEAYSLVLQIFDVLTEYESTSDEDVANAITRLVGMYSQDPGAQPGGAFGAFAPPKFSKHCITILTILTFKE